MSLFLARTFGPEGRNTMWKGFQKPKRLASELESLTEKYGRFSAQPFERGWGTTVGNALRRALLSSIEGAAITAVKIEGVLHEFSSIPGVVEDATDIILNLKQVPIKLNTDLPKTIYLNVEQPGTVTSRSEEHTSELQSRLHLVCRLLLEKKKHELSFLHLPLYVDETGFSRPLIFARDIAADPDSLFRLRKRPLLVFCNVHAMSDSRRYLR